MVSTPRFILLPVIISNQITKVWLSESAGDPGISYNRDALSRTKQTHCLRGHPRTPENLRSNGVSLYCKICAIDNEKNGRARRRKADPFGFALGQLRRNAKKRGLEFSVTKKDFLPLPTHCPVLNVELDYSGAGTWNAASIDRSDCSKGYIPGNVVIMSKRANMLKNDASPEELRKVLEYIRNISKPLQ
jgi:hypothetical protein